RYLKHVERLLDEEPEDAEIRAHIGDLIVARSRRRGPLPSVEDVRRDLGAGVDPASPKMTVGEWLDVWLAGQHQLRQTTREYVRGHVENYLRPHLGHLRLDRLRPAHIDAMFVWIRRRNELVAAGDPPPDPLDRRRQPAPLGVAAQRQVFAHLRTALNAAVGPPLHLIPYNPCAGVRLLRTPRRRYVVWTPEEAGRFLAATADDSLHAAWRVALFAGLRRGELCGLRWSDVDWRTGRLTVERQLVHVGREVVTAELKTDEGTRVVKLDAATLDALRRHRDRQRFERAYDLGGWVFADPAGAPWRPKALSAHFGRVVRKVEGVPVVRLHDLRHIHATWGLAAGVAVKVMSGRLGHANTAITQNLYQHALPELDEDAAARIAALVPPRRVEEVGS
ncbi:MAG TPA: tyrosine-type recombinase/integrase, partial [Kribbellaceae bacterium]